jgi:hypothetical protein
LLIILDPIHQEKNFNEWQEYDRGRTPQIL